MSSSKAKKGKMAEAADSLSDGEAAPECLKKLRSEDVEERRASLMSPGNKMAGTNGLRGRGSDKPAELFRKDLISAMKIPDSEPLLPDDYFVIGDPWRQEWERGVQVPVNPDHIPHVKVRVVAGNEKLHGMYPFKIPKKLLHSQKDEAFQQGLHELHETHKLAEQVCRYDLDYLDVTWLTSLNDEREAMGLPIIEEWVMEKILEEIELQCHDQMQVMIKTVEGLGIEYDENVVCDVCRSPDSEDQNEMVFCDSCDICVHQACYGIQSIPDGSWLCRTCALGIRPQCILCPKGGGAMKSTKSGSKWAHVACALWIPEVSIGCAEKMEPITKISHIPSSRWGLVCSVCRDRLGACIQCSVKSCKTAFHVTCAFQGNLEMRTILDEIGDEEIQLKAYCAKHTKKLRGGGSEDSSPMKDDSLCLSPVSPKKESEMTEEEKTELRSHRLQRLSEEFYRCASVDKVANALKLPEETVDYIYNYWILKRKSEFNKVLLTPKTEEAELLSKQQEDSLIARMKMFVHLRQDLERVRNLCYMVNRREKMRRRLYLLKEEIFWRQAALLTDPEQRYSARETAVICRAHILQNSVYDRNEHILELARQEDPELNIDLIDHDLEHVKVRHHGPGRVRRDSIMSQGEEGTKRERQPSGPTIDKKERQKERELKHKLHSVFQRRNGLRDRDPERDKEARAALEMEMETDNAASAPVKSENPEVKVEVVEPPESTPVMTTKRKGRKPSVAEETPTSDGGQNLRKEILKRESKKSATKVAESIKTEQPDLPIEKVAASPKKDRRSHEKQSPRSADPAPVVGAEKHSTTLQPLEPNSSHLKERNSTRRESKSLQLKDTRTKSDVTCDVSRRRHSTSFVSKSEKHRRKSELNGGIIPDHRMIVSESMKAKVQRRILRANKRTSQVNGLHESNLKKLDLFYTSRKSQSENIPGHSLNPKGLYIALPDGASAKSGTQSSRSSRRGSISHGDITPRKRTCPVNDGGTPETRGKRRKIESDLESNASDRLFENVDGEISIRSSRSTTPDREFALRSARRDIDFNRIPLHRQLEQRLNKEIKDSIVRSVELSDDQSSVVDPVEEDTDSEFHISDTASESSGVSTRITRQKAMDNLETLSVESGHSGNSSRHGPRARTSKSKTALKR